MLDEKMQKALMASVRSMLGGDPDSLYGKALAALEARDFARGASLMEQCVRERRETLGPMHHHTLKAQSEWGQALDACRRSKKAVEVLRSCLKLQRESPLGGDMS